MPIGEDKKKKGMKKGRPSKLTPPAKRLLKDAKKDRRNEAKTNAKNSKNSKAATRLINKSIKAKSPDRAKKLHNRAVNRAYKMTKK